MANATAQGASAGDQSVVVTATRHPIAEADAPAALTVVTRSEIEARGADNALSALRGEVSIGLQGRSIGGRKVLSIRGMESRHTLFLVDGRRVSASDGVVGQSDFQYDWIAADDIERIEVVRGPMSVLYGSEAMGGVVNVITRQPGDAWRLGASTEGSQADGSRGGEGHRVSLRADGPLGSGVSLRAGAAQTRTSAVASKEDPRLSELEGRDKRDAWLALGWRSGRGQRIDFEHRAGTEQRWADARERGGARRYHQTINDIDRSLSSLGWETDWGGQAASTQLRAYEAAEEVENRRTAGVTVNVPQRLVDRVLEGQARATRGAHALTAGFEARNESLEDPGLPNGRSLARHRAWYVQEEATLSGNVALTLGLRHDDHQLYVREWSPRAYAVWRLGGGCAVKGGASHGFKAPNLKQIVPGARAEGPNIFLGNAALRPERSDGVELGAGCVDDGAQWQAMVFDQRVEDLIEARLVAAGTAPGTGTYSYENLSRARMSGLEAGLARPLGRGFAAQLSYTYLDARNGDGQRLDRRPRHSASARLGWQGGSWRAGVDLEHSGRQLLPSTTVGAPSQSVPDVTLVGAHLTRALPAGLEATFGVNNLGNVRLAERSPLFTGVEAPRTWRVGLRGRW